MILFVGRQLRVLDASKLATLLKLEKQNASSTALRPYATRTGANISLGATETAHMSTIVDHNDKTLALLYPPGLPGGYRNQGMRFISFVVYAKRQNMTQLLLNSLLWSTQVENIEGRIDWFPIPFEWVFDVDHWNTFAPKQVPLLLRDDQIKVDQAIEGLCWTKASDIEGTELLRSEDRIRQIGSKTRNRHSNFTHEYSGQTTTINHLQRAALLQGALTPLLDNVTVPFITGRLKLNPRKQDFLLATEHCRQPFVYGGGTGAGRLWNEYLGFHRGLDIAGSHRNTSSVPFETDVWVYRALRPSPLWRDLAEQCAAQHAPSKRYMALHARVELEIMGHLCGNNMEKNLTAILERVLQLDETLTSSEDKNRKHISGLFIAVSRAGMEVKGTTTYEKFRHFADENLQTLNIVTGQNTSETLAADNTRQLFRVLQKNLPVFECGGRFVENFYATHPDVPSHGALLNAVINFHLAVYADYFIGVKGSSFSTDVLTTRYWLGKGDTNYRYTQTGIERVQGLPEPHGLCKK